MPLRVLIAPDKFKGTLAASSAAEAIARGWRSARPSDSLDLLPISDGGDGFGEVIRKLLGAKVRQVEAVDAAHRPCVAQWWWVRESRTAVIESAAVIGLAMLPPGRFHPFELDTFGLGAMMRAAALAGAKRCIVGIGGSATNDGGFGFARALGWQFQDVIGDPIDKWTDLHRLASVIAPRRRRWFRELLVAVDVGNPLLGSRGATRVYGPQKGLRPSDFARAERCLRKLAAVVGAYFRRDCARNPGAGAAGGLGFGLEAFAGGRLESGLELIAQLTGLNKRLRTADIVITGEGAIDNSTIMGKGVGEIARRCKNRGIPCLALAGTINGNIRARKLFSQALALTDLTTLRGAKKNPAFWLEKLTARVAGEWVK